MSARERPVALPWLAAGFTVWSTAFLALYGAHALGCARGWEGQTVGPTSLLRLVLVTLWVAHLALAAGVAALARRRHRSAGNEVSGLLGELAFALGIVALAATLWIGLPALVLPLCGG